MRNPYRSFPIAFAALALWASVSVSISAAAPADKPAVPYRHHALLEKQIGFYAVYLPKNFKADSAKGKKYPLCIILHGSGSTEIGHGAMAEAYASEDIIFMAPRAPYPAYGIFMGNKEEGFTAWPTYPREWGEWEDPDFPKQELKATDPVQLYADWIADCVGDVRKRYPVSDAKAIVVGHSQGARFAHVFAVRHPELIKAYAAYAGNYTGPGLENDTAAKALLAGKVFPLILHCENDSTVPVAESRALIRYLQANKVPFESRLYPGGNHWITTRPGNDIRAFIYKWALSRTAPARQGFLAISKVLKPSRADTLGLAVGDRIGEFDGKKIRTMDDYLEAIEGAKGKASVSMIVIRDGKPKPYTMPQGGLGVYTNER